MPGFDKSGPGGQGPMTGRGMGNCQTQGQNDRPMGGGRGMGMGGGRGLRGGGAGVGGGRGMRMRNQAFAQNPQAAGNVAVEDINELYNQVEALKEQVAELTNRLAAAKPDKDQNA